MKKLNILIVAVVSVIFTGCATTGSGGSGVPVQKVVAPVGPTEVFEYDQKPVLVDWQTPDDEHPEGSSVYNWETGMLTKFGTPPQYPKRGEENLPAWPGNAGFSTQAERDAVAFEQSQREYAEAQRELRLRQQMMQLQQQQYQNSGYQNYGSGNYIPVPSGTGYYGGSYHPEGHVAAAGGYAAGAVVVTPRYNPQRYNNPDYPWQRSYKTERLEVQGDYRNYR